MTTMVAIGTRKGLWLASSPDRQRWTMDGPHFLMNEVASVVVDTRTEPTRIIAGFASSHWGPTLAHSDDLGRTWAESQDGAIAFPPDTGAALARVWALAVDPHDDQVVWAGSEPQALWRSADRGAHFELNRGLFDHPHRPTWGAGAGGAAIHTVVPDPVDAGTVLVAMSTGGIYETTDGGQSWAPRNSGISAGFMPDNFPEYGQCVHKIARDAAVPTRLYAQNHHGVYRSEDNGHSWTSIADGLPTDFGFSVVAHPRQAGTLWLVPITSQSQHIPPEAHLQVQRSTDAGASWQTCDTGLPATSYTCVLRDAAAVDGNDPAGYYFGTRTGDVFASTDQGDSFVRIAEQLPDVLCVRAAVLP
ncbi:MAG TPA: exo-alpha-sialidase [Dermatophilaceae bacterium]|nr:exo-alpha-sialidase [Dermatophilaceae bacterium]